MLLEFKDTEGRIVFLDTRHVLIVRGDKGTTSVKLTNGDVVQLSDSEREVVEGINRAGDK